MSGREGLERRARGRTALATGAGLLSLPAALAVGAHPSPLAWLGFGSLLGLQALLWFRFRQPRALALGNALVVVQGALAASSVRGPAAVALAFVTLATSVFAWRAWVELRFEAGVSTRLPRGGSGPARARDARLAVLVTAVLLVVAPLLSILVTSALAGLEGEGDAAPSTERSRAAAPARATASGAGRSARAFAGTFPEDLRWASSRPLEDDTEVVVVRPLVPGDESWRALEPLYLRARALERFTTTGLEAGEADEGAGLIELDPRRDAEGWCALLAAPDEPTWELGLEQLPLRGRPPSESRLLTPGPLVALDCPGARLTAGGELRAPLPEQGALRFRTRSLERRFERVAVPERADLRAPAETRALPAPSPELATFAAFAAEVARGATSDRERVARVLACFREGFRYDPSPDGLPGLAGLAAFLERRAGGCAHHAATAVLMLRSLGLPARVVTGFLARRPGPEAEVLVATPRSAHAWFEVAFEGVGWITCDPTPGGAPGPREPGVASAARHAWTGSVELVASFLGGERLSWRRLRGTALEAWTRLGARGEERGWSAGLLLALLGGGAWLLRRARPARRARRSTRASPRSEAALARFLSALERAGQRRPPARTLREHVRALVLREGPALAPLEACVEALYRVRFGREGWSASEEACLARALAALEGLGAER